MTNLHVLIRTAGLLAIHSTLSRGIFAAAQGDPAIAFKASSPTNTNVTYAFPILAGTSDSAESEIIAMAVAPAHDTAPTQVTYSFGSTLTIDIVDAPDTITVTVYTNTLQTYVTETTTVVAPDPPTVTSTSTTTHVVTVEPSTAPDLSQTSMPDTATVALTVVPATSVSSTSPPTTSASITSTYFQLSTNSTVPSSTTISPPVTSANLTTPQTTSTTTRVSSTSYYSASSTAKSTKTITLIKTASTPKTTAPVSICYDGERNTPAPCSTTTAGDGSAEYSGASTVYLGSSGSGSYEMICLEWIAAAALGAAAVIQH